MSYMRNLRVTTEQTVEGFTVPKNSHAMANLTKFMKVTIMIWTDISPFFSLQDPEYWEHPNEFRYSVYFELCSKCRIVFEALLLICNHFLVGLSGF